MFERIAVSPDDAHFWALAPYLGRDECVPKWVHVAASLVGAWGREGALIMRWCSERPTLRFPAFVIALELEDEPSRKLGVVRALLRAGGYPCR